jgi:hypothetical protein
MFPDRHGAVSLDLDRAYVFPVSENKGEVGNETVEIGEYSMQNPWFTAWIRVSFPVSYNVGSLVLYILWSVIDAILLEPGIILHENATTP